MSNLPHVARVRHDTKRRRLIVTCVDHLAPKMVRVVLRGEDLPGFTSLGFDDHVKVFFSSGPAGILPEPAMRDVTPRRLPTPASSGSISISMTQAPRPSGRIG